MTAPLSFEELQGLLTIEDQALESLRQYDALLHKWQKRFNLVGRSTLVDSVRRHFLDSAQLKSLMPDKQATIIDLGSGAGFPGLVLSVLGMAQVHLIESDANKCEFLRQAIRATGASATVHRTRIEDYQGPAADIVTSRACASLEKLLKLAENVSNVSGESTRMLFLKGQKWQDELTVVRSACHIDVQVHRSQSDPLGVILEISGITDR